MSSNSHTAVKPPPILIGDLLVRSEMTSASEMAEAVPVSLKTGLPIGRVLVASGSLAEHHLHQALLAQSLIRDSLLSLDIAIQALRVCVREHYTLEQALDIVGWQPEAFSDENKLGQLFLAAGVITQIQLDEALRVFFTAGLPLARVLVRKRVITNLVAYAALSSQQLLRESKLTRDQAVQALKAAAASNAVIEDDYVTGYLRMCPPNQLRLGELLILAQLVSEDDLIKAVENALQKGHTLGEILVERGMVLEDTMERALDAQRMVTKGQLDPSKAGDMLRKANYQRISMMEAVERAAPAILVSPESKESTTTATAPALPSKPAIDESRFTATLHDIPAMEKGKKRSHQEVRARQLLGRLLEKLEALHVRNNYLINVLDKDGKNTARTVDLQEVKRQIEKMHDFDGSMDVIEKVLTQIETSAFQNGFLRARLDVVTSEAERADKLRQAERARTTDDTSAPPAPPSQKPGKSGKAKRKKRR